MITITQKYYLTPSTPKQIKGVKQKPPVHKFPEKPLQVDGKDLKYVKPSRKWIH